MAAPAGWRGGRAVLSCMEQPYKPPYARLLCDATEGRRGSGGPARAAGAGDGPTVPTARCARPVASSVWPGDVGVRGDGAALPGPQPVHATVARRLPRAG